MSFQQKGTYAMLGIQLFVYGWYFIYIFGRVSELGAEQVDYKVQLMFTIGATVVFTAVALIIIAIRKPEEAGDVDERDQKISLLSARVAGVVLLVCVFSVLGLLMSGASVFWIAQALIASLALSDMVMRSAMLVYYQRGV